MFVSSTMTLRPLWSCCSCCRSHSLVGNWMSTMILIRMRLGLICSIYYSGWLRPSRHVLHDVETLMRMAGDILRHSFRSSFFPWISWRPRPGKMYPRHAAFIEGAEDFAASFFNISAPEADGPDARRLPMRVWHCHPLRWCLRLPCQARAMDPQQRLVPERKTFGDIW